MVYANPSAFYLGGGLPACHRYSNQVASVFAHQLHGVRLERFCPWQRMFFLYLHPLVPDGTEKDRVEIYRLLCGDRSYTAALYLPPPGHRNYFVNLHIVYPGDDELNLTIYKERHPMSLSGGQKQRTAIGVAALRDAEVLIFDEPTSGLDYKNMESVAEILSALSKRRKAILVISHDNELLMKICSRVIRVDERTSS